MKLKDLLTALPEFDLSRAFLKSSELLLQDVSNLQSDSRRVSAGDVFVAIRGDQFDGHDHLQHVLQLGARAVVVEAGRAPNGLANSTALIVPVANTRRALSQLAARFFGDPSKEMFCLGVTGTNGKTSTVYLLEHLFNLAHRPCAVMGTVDHHLRGQVWPSTHTTSDAVTVHQRLRDFREAGAQVSALEVTSHALDQMRVHDVHWNSVGFTNLTRDHLDYHQSFEAYFAAKQKLFTDLMWNSDKPLRFAVVNSDDPWARRLQVAAPVNVWTYGQGDRPDFSWKVVKAGIDGQVFALKSPFGSFESAFPMVGDFAVANAVLALAMGVSCGLSLDSSLMTLSSFPGVPGRLQRVPSKEKKIFVDYAHTPDALEKACRALKNLTPGKLIVVFGCGGDRDKGKRPQMGRIADRWADEVHLTSDNPRSEDPLLILQEVRAGFSRLKPFEEVDRARAIANAVQSARSDDVVLIAGKGHERYQDFGDRRVEFDDVQVTASLLN